MEISNKHKSGKHRMVLSFAVGAALGGLYGAFILGPALKSLPEGIAIGISVGIGAGVSIGAIFEVGKKSEKNKKQNKLLIAVIVATLLLVISTAFLAFSGIS